MMLVLPALLAPKRMVRGRSSRSPVSVRLRKRSQRTIRGPVSGMLAGAEDEESVAMSRVRRAGDGEV
jgi:hypothetical protein